MHSWYQSQDPLELFVHSIGEDENENIGSIIGGSIGGLVGLLATILGGGLIIKGCCKRGNLCNY